MLELIVPAGVHSQECFGEPPDDQLFPEEQKIIAHAVPERRREYAAVRGCARACLGRLGYPPLPILPGAGGAPTWPAGICGSLTHCKGYTAAAVAPVTRICGIGIDAEPDQPLPEGVLDLIATPAEHDYLATIQSEFGGPRWDRLLFSAKEALYKAWFPLVGQWLDHHEVEIVFEPQDGTFTAQLTRDDLIINNRPIRELHGRWTHNRGILATAVVVLPG
jgi:4'-phosphopantetheinyl transferase EntD